MHQIAEQIFSYSGVLAFARAIGFTAVPADLPNSYDVSRVVSFGRRGSLQCIFIQCDDVTADLPRVSRRIRAEQATQLQFFICADHNFDRIVVATFAVDDLATLVLERGHVRPSDIDALTELVPQNGESGVALAMRHARALDRRRVTQGFFADFRGQRAMLSEAWSGLPPRQKAERDQLALLFLSRMMFLYFLQRRGFLCGDPAYFLGKLRAHLIAPVRCTFYRGVLRPLFFGVLNRRPEKRTQRAAALGALPYLNGGLFERHHLERRYPELDLPDAVLRGVFEHLLERYRFTATETNIDHAVDPEMLGRVFEGLMSDVTRQNTGTFYTPAPVVSRIVQATFAAHLEGCQPQDAARLLRELRVLDPACGSGAFLLGALSHVSRLRGLLEGRPAAELRHDVVARTLHGLDVQHDAALLCALRLWLCLIPDDAWEKVQPLPNLDRRLRQGDALVDPFDLAADHVADAQVRAARRRLQPLVQRYTTCDPEERLGVHRLVLRRERQLARAWLNALHARLDHDTRELRAQAAARDLFGERPLSASVAHARLADVEARVAELRRLRSALRDSGSHPFFSFNVHFADAERTGFDVVLCNPPWIRSHNWPKSMTTALRRRFRVCASGGQVDLALVFLERAISLLAPGGTLGIILPAKFLRSASAGAARALLLEQLEIVSLEDHSLDQRSIFGADAFACILIARRKREVKRQLLQVRMVRRKSDPLEYRLPAERLLLDSQEPRSIWLLAPPAVRHALQHMQTAGVAVAERFRIRRGIVTGANSVMILCEARGKLGNLAAIRSAGEHEAVIEDSVIRPLVRGADIRAWAASPQHKVIFCHRDDSGSYAPPPRRTQRYLLKHAALLGVSEARGRIGALQHVDADTVRHKIAWHDLAQTLNAVVLPARAHCLGAQRPLIPLNTVYFIAADPQQAHLLAACFNSLPLRVFARAIAERAKDAHFRFFAGTVGRLPLPRAFLAELVRLSEHAHTEGFIDDAGQRELDELVARAFRLDRAGLQALRSFDAFLRGE